MHPSVCVCIYVCMCVCICIHTLRKEMFYLTMHFTFYLWLYGIRLMVKDHFLISSKGSFICTILESGKHVPWPLLYQMWSTGWTKK